VKNDRGSLILKRSFRGVTPIRRASGTKDRGVYAQMDLMLHALYSQGRLDVLEAIARGRMHPLSAYSQWQQNRELRPAETMTKLLDAWMAWEATIVGKDHRESIGTTRRALKITGTDLIDILPDRLIDYKKRASDKVRSVNLARSHVSSFLRDTLGRSHRLYQRVRDTQPLKRKPRERGTPHDIVTILDLVKKLNEIQAGVGDMAWSMAVAGMGNKEYWHDGFEVQRDRVQVYGEKREGRKRVVPKWDGELVLPLCWEGRFRDLLRTASGDTVMIYDLRRSFTRWCREAGIIEMNVEAYMGHGPKSMTDLYAFGILPGQLAEDAAKLRAYRDSKVGSLVTSAQAHA
jgi:hypothetical protein